MCRTGIHLLLPHRSVDRTQSCFPKVVKTLHPNLLCRLGRPCKACMDAPHLQICKQLYIHLVLFVCKQRREAAAPQRSPYALWLVKGTLVMLATVKCASLSIAKQKLQIRDLRSESNNVGRFDLAHVSIWASSKVGSPSGTDLQRRSIAIVKSFILKS
jgi:hypothetical protein